MEEKFFNAAFDGKVEKLEEILRNHPTLNVNWQDNSGWSTLQDACYNGQEPVVSNLLAHPDIDVNLRDRTGWTPFMRATISGSTPCIRVMLKDLRVRVNQPMDDGYTPLFWASHGGDFDVVRWWIASGREMDLGEPGNSKTDAIDGAKKNGKTEVATLLERFKENPEETRHAMRVELSLLYELAAEMFALVVFVSDGLLQVNDTTPSPAAKFLSIAAQLPLELQMVLCYRLIGSDKEIIHGKDSEVAFKSLARKLW